MLGVWTSSRLLFEKSKSKKFILVRPAVTERLSSDRSVSDVIYLIIILSVTILSLVSFEYEYYINALLSFLQCLTMHIPVH